MNNTKNKEASWTMCPECQGTGKKNRKLGKKMRLRYRIACEKFEKTNGEGIKPILQAASQYLCPNCNGSGLLYTTTPPIADKDNFPHVAIIGGGIGGVALAVACLHRSIPFTIFERDSSFDARSQGYGLTLQQASNAIKGLGILEVKEGVNSNLHIVYDTAGKVIIEWGKRISIPEDVKTFPKRMNMHVARQSLRSDLIEQLGGNDAVQWGHQLIDFKKCADESVELHFQVNGKLKKVNADLVVGADGIRSSVRKILIGEEKTPLHYMGLMVILGICPLIQLQGFEHPLLDSATVFQTVNGNERIYMMPFSSDSIMWQLSFPMEEKEAQALSAKGAKALKEEAVRIASWHTPIPEILSATKESEISGYPVYDRELLQPELLNNAGPITLIGDAAHPMSPFKGQGANQALLDALALARSISNTCGPLSQWKEVGIRKIVLSDFESEMLERSAPKVKDSAEAAQLLHSDVVLREGDETKGRSLKRKDE
ncbi:NAD(P)/FAD-dependent oxidoreductase [soil metagenome]